MLRPGMAPTFPPGLHRPSRHPRFPRAYRHARAMPSDGRTSVLGRRLPRLPRRRARRSRPLGDSRETVRPAPPIGSPRRRRPGRARGGSRGCDIRRHGRPRESQLVGRARGRLGGVRCADCGGGGSLRSQRRVPLQARGGDAMARGGGRAPVRARGESASDRRRGACVDDTRVVRRLIYRRQDGPKTGGVKKVGDARASRATMSSKNFPRDFAFRRPTAATCHTWTRALILTR